MIQKSFLTECSDFKYRKWAQKIQSFFQSALKSKSENMIPLHHIWTGECTFQVKELKDARDKIILKLAKEQRLI